MAKTRRRNVHRRRTKKHRRRHRTKRRVKRRRKTTRKKRGRGWGSSKLAKLGVAALATSTAMGQGMGYGISPSMGTAAAVNHFNTVPCAEFHISDLPPHSEDHGASTSHAAEVTKAALRKKRSCKRRGKPMRNPNTGKPMSKNEAKKAQKRIRAQEKAAKEAAEAAKAKEEAIKEEDAKSKAEEATKREEALKKIKDDLKVVMEAHEKEIEKIEKKEEAEKLAAKLEEQAEKTKTSKAKEAAEAAKAAKAEAEQAKAEAEQAKAAKAEAEQQMDMLFRDEEVVREMESERNEGMGGAEMAAYGAAATAAGLATHGLLRGRRRVRNTTIVTRNDGRRELVRINDGRVVRALTPERR